MKTSQTKEIKDYIRKLISHIQEAKSVMPVMNKAQRAKFDKQKELQCMVLDQVFKKVVEIEDK